ncbi:hypothetical protein ACFLUU_07475 [Chloroflexota bacterium]
MIERVHEHILSELHSNTRTDTIFVLTAIILNLLALGINSGIASASSRGGVDTTTIIIMFTFVALVLVVNFVVEIGLIRGRQMRGKLLNGLLKMYKDQGVEGYYDPSLLSNYNTRYNLFMLVVLFTGLVALIVPFIVM